MKLTAIKLNVNGRIYDLTIRPHWTLLKVLRDRLKLTGTKAACETGECGACSVLVDGKVVHSCVLLACQAQDKQVTTIEGLVDNPVTRALREEFARNGAIQCGYCTPGIMVAASAFLKQNPHPTELEIRDMLTGNLCRCTGYSTIIQSIVATVRRIQGEKLSAGVR